MTWQRLDEDLLSAVQAGGGPAARVWEPPEVAVVLGRSNDPVQEVHLAACAEDRVPVLRRRGGGGTVVLAPGCLVVTLVGRVAEPLAVGRHLAEAVDAVRAALARAVGVEAEVRGTGDLCLDDRKVLGSSAFGGRGTFFYQASLLVDLDLGLVERYLRHPSREPAYRRGRPHRAFLTTLREAGYAWECGDLGKVLEGELSAGAQERSHGPQGGGPVVFRNARGV